MPNVIYNILYVSRFTVVLVLSAAVTSTGINLRMGGGPTHTLHVVRAASAVERTREPLFGVLTTRFVAYVFAAACTPVTLSRLQCVKSSTKRSAARLLYARPPNRATVAKSSLGVVPGQDRVSTFDR